MPYSRKPETTGGLETAADALKLIEPHFTAPFFSPEAHRNVVETAAMLPAILSLSYMFERPIAMLDHPVDFFQWIPNGGRPDVLSGDSPGMPEAYFEHEPWRRIREFARHWNDESSPLYDVQSFWLEYDVRQRPTGLPIPLIFFTVEPEIHPRLVFEHLHPTPYDDPSLATFRRCWDAIPEISRYRTAGILYARPTDALRLIVIMSPEEAMGYLETVGWPGSVADLERAVEPFLKFHDEVSLHLDAHSDGVLPQVGFEVYADDRAMYKGRGGDCGPLLERAVQASLCHPAIRDALVAWPGTETVTLPSGAAMRVERMFHHVKIVSSPSLELQAKAYTTAEYEVIEA